MKKKAASPPRKPNKGIKSANDFTPRKSFFLIAAILIISFVVYLPSLKAGFFWDDDVYILKNPYLHSINFKAIFSSFFMGNYHPLTILVYAIEYHFFGLSEKGFHAVNLVLHLANVVLVFYAVSLLSGKIEIAAIASLLFGIHPLHIESVAWISELKDLLSTGFFLASWISYFRYLNGFRKKYLLLSILFFTISLLSKAMAVSLPFILLLTDYLKDRKITAKVFFEKIPFFLLALLFGVIAVFAQQSSGAVMDAGVYVSLPLRIVFACFSFISYLSKLLLPIHLSNYYPYPTRGGGDVPVIYFINVVFFLALIVAAYYSLRYSKKIFFGLAFFCVTILPVLQLLQVGGAMMADRYSYIPSIGIFYLAGVELYHLWKKNNANLKTVAAALLTLAVIFYSAKTYARCEVWKSDISLWTDVINQYQTIEIAYYNRGLLFEKDNKYDEAIKDYSAAIQLTPNYFNALHNRALMLQKKGNYNEALSDFSKAIALRPDSVNVLVNRANLLLNLKRNEEAIKDYNQAITIQPDFPNSYFNRAVAFSAMEKTNEALTDLNKTIQLQPDFYQAYNNRGIIYMNQKKYTEALKDFNKSIALAPDFASPYFNKGVIGLATGNKEEACADFKKAADLGLQMASDWYAQQCR